MLFLFRSAPEVEKRIHSKLFRKFWRSRGTKEPAYITVTHHLEDDFLEQPAGSTRPSVGQRDEAKKESSLHLGSNFYASELDLSNFSMK